MGGGRCHGYAIYSKNEEKKCRKLFVINVMWLICTIAQ